MSSDNNEHTDTGNEETPSDPEKKVNNEIDFSSMHKDIAVHTGLFSHLTAEQSMQFVNSMILNCQRQLVHSTPSCSVINVAKANTETPKSNDNGVYNSSPRSNDIQGITPLGTNVNITKESNNIVSNKVVPDTILGKNSKKPKSKRRKMENKDPDTVSLHGSSDIDGNIEKLINSSSESDESPSEDDLDIQKLRSELLEDDEIGPPVSKDLAELFQKLKESGLSKEKVASKAKEYPKPANCDLETKQVNPEIWSGIITTKERSADLQLQKGQKLISKASYAILKVTQSAISANKDKKRRKESIKNIIKASTDALAFISTAHLHTEKLRRELLLKKLSYDQRSIGKDVPANDKLLFGDNLNKRLAEAAGVSKLKPRKFSQSYSQGYSQPSSSTYTKRFQKNNYSKNEYRPQKSSRGRRGG